MRRQTIAWANRIRYNGVATHRRIVSGGGPHGPSPFLMFGYLRVRVMRAAFSSMGAGPHEHPEETKNHRSTHHGSAADRSSSAAVALSLSAACVLTDRRLDLLPLEVCLTLDAPAPRVSSGLRLARILTRPNAKPCLRWQPLAAPYGDDERGACGSGSGTEFDGR